MCSFIFCCVSVLLFAVRVFAWLLLLLIFCFLLNYNQFWLHLNMHNINTRNHHQRKLIFAPFVVYFTIETTIFRILCLVFQVFLNLKLCKIKLLLSVAHFGIDPWYDQEWLHLAFLWSLLSYCAYFFLYFFQKLFSAFFCGLFVLLLVFIARRWSQKTNY